MAERGEYRFLGKIQLYWTYRVHQFKISYLDLK